jgi:hypothetical protein
MYVIKIVTRQEVGDFQFASVMYVMLGTSPQDPFSHSSWIFGDADTSRAVTLSLPLILAYICSSVAGPDKFVYLLQHRLLCGSLFLAFFFDDDEVFRPLTLLLWAYSELR